MKMGDIENVKFNTNLYKSNFLATKKQKDYIEENIEFSSYSEDEQVDIISRLESMTKKEASEIIQYIINDINYSYDDWYDYQW